MKVVFRGDSAGVPGDYERNRTSARSEFGSGLRRFFVVVGFTARACHFCCIPGCAPYGPFDLFDPVGVDHLAVVALSRM